MTQVRRPPIPAPVAVSATGNWQLQAACRTIDSGVFFPPEGERGEPRTSREARALRVCHRCPVLEACRRYALAVQEPYGVWGGQTEGERAAILRGRRRETTAHARPGPRTSPCRTRTGEPPTPPR